MFIHKQSVSLDFLSCYLDQIPSNHLSVTLNKHCLLYNTFTWSIYNMKYPKAYRGCTYVYYGCRAYIENVYSYSRFVLFLLFSDYSDHEIKSY